MNLQNSLKCVGNIFAITYNQQLQQLYQLLKLIALKVT